MSSLSQLTFNIVLVYWIYDRKLYLNRFPTFSYFLCRMAFLFGDGKEVECALVLLYFLFLPYLKPYISQSVVTNLVTLMVLVCSSLLMGNYIG